MKFYQTQKGDIVSLENVRQIVSSYGTITICYKDTDQTSFIKVPSGCSTKATMEKIADILKGDIQ